jgi:hypothetical protein
VLQIDRVVSVYTVAFRAFDHTLPLGIPPLRIVLIRNEDRVFIRQRGLAGFAPHEPKTQHRLRFYPRDGSTGRDRAWVIVAR